MLATLLTAGALCAQEDDQPIELPERYLLAYPTAERFCPPIRSTFYEAVRSVSVVNGRTFRHKPNGGYGLPVVDRSGGQNLIHVGADLGWRQVGEPVFAVANGIVRVSTGPHFEEPQGGKRPVDPQHLSWGNFIAVEHRLADGSYVTTLYGHLDSRRLAQMGDVVTAGQQIGFIGRRHPHINGGYVPHLHFGVRTGRMAEADAELLRIQLNGRPESLVLSSFDEDVLRLKVSADFPANLSLHFNGHSFMLRSEAGVASAPASLLWCVQRTDFQLIGYALSKYGWRDPIKFLKEQNAHSKPAPYRLTTQIR